MIKGPWNRPPGYRVAHKGIATIRSFAQRTRLALAISDDGISMVSLLEHMLHKCGFHFHIIEDVRMQSDVARVEPHSGRIFIGNSAYEGLHNGERKYELLVPHEIGHIVLEHVLSFAYASPQRAHHYMSDSEVQADYFSHEFAMPVELVQTRCRSEKQIQEVFNVLPLEAKIRADTLRKENFINW